MKTDNRMRTTFQRLVICASALFAGAVAHAQGVQLTIPEYETLKASGSLPPVYHVVGNTMAPERATKQPPVQPEEGKPTKGQLKGGGQNGFCNCWIEPDNTYTTQTSWPLGSANEDDGADGPFALPFSFNLYGDLYTEFYLNINGNISFGAPYNTFTAEGFPSPNFVMVAPFWADVQLTNDAVGKIKWKVTEHALYVNWSDVGYYSQHYDKRNSFQLIVTDGTDPVIGIGNNVSFCYKDMQWTTGDASQGTNGFGGTPSTVGANRGNGVDYIQFTRNDHDGLDYDGPFGNADGVSWLDSKNFRFTTATSTQNIPPIVNSNFLCDTVEVCMGELVDFYLSFLTPEADQEIIDAHATAPDLPPFDYTVDYNGTSASIHVQFIPTVQDTGYHTVTFYGQDNGADSLTSQASIVLAVYYTPATPPSITGDTVACEGVGTVLTASAGYDNYIWTNGYYGTTVLVGPGTYICTATSGNCRLASNIITVTGVPNPDPSIEGAFAACGGEPQTLSTDQPYSTYLWSNGSTDPTITVGTGDYSVTVTDANGCEGTAPGVTVFSPNDPTALFYSNIPSIIFPGIGAIYTDTSSGNGSNIVNWQWSIDTIAVGSGQSIAHLFDTPGDYTITLTVTTADGCTDTYSFVQHVIPTEVIAPNVFSPNGDGVNDYLEFTNAQYYLHNQLKVFNRWGMQVYENSNYVNDWSGKDLPEGTYFYVFKMDSGKEFTGHVTLLR